MNALHQVEIEGDLQVWISEREAQGYSISVVTLGEVMTYYQLSSPKDVTPEYIRLFLRVHYTQRTASSTEQGRYLGLLGLPPRL